MRNSSAVRRRAVLMAGAAGVISLAGCLGDITNNGGPQQRTYELRIVRPDQTLQMRIEPPGEVEDVIRINVGDTVVFNITNETGIAVGFHNHAIDEEVVLDPGGDSTMEFEATEEMVGRQEIEGWVVDGNSDDSSGEEGEHGESTTTLAVVEVRPQRG